MEFEIIQGPKGLHAINIKDAALAAAAKAQAGNETVRA